MTARPLYAVFVIQKLLGLSGGAERIFIETAQAMAQRGIKVDLLIYDNSSGEPAYDIARLSLKNLFPLPKTAGSNTTPKALKAASHAGLLGHLKWAVTHGLFGQRLKSALRQNPPDVIVAFLPHAITAAARAGHALGIPVIASVHNVPEADFGDSLRWDQNPIYRKRARRALSQADAITVLLPEFRDWFDKQERPRVSILPNAIRQLSPPTNVPREKIILGVGRLTDVKRFDLLVNAWAQLADDFPEWRIHIYGEGPNQARLAAQIASAGLGDVVHLKGVTSTLGPIYDSASLLCHPAQFEGFGLVVGEAMAHGLPVVGFADCPGVNTLIRDGENGRLVPNGDPAGSLATTLGSLLGNEIALRQIGEAAQTITQRYNSETITDQWENLIRDTAQSGSH